MSDPVRRIAEYDAGRHPERLTMKCCNMRSGSFVFPVCALPKAYDEGAFAAS